MAATLDRASVLRDPSLAGVALCRAYSDLVDDWLSELFDLEVGPAATGVALVAVGGYGRAELSPGSDIDLLLLHAGRKDIADIAEHIWYPIWDQSLKLGHSVRTVKEALSLAADDLDTATSLLSARCVAGDDGLARELSVKALALWQKRAKRWLAELSRTVRERHERAGEVAFLLEPDLKDGRGGLRDAHAIRWAEAAQSVMLEGDDDALTEAYETILAARVELHRRTGRAGDRLLLEEQDEVSRALAYSDADEMMRCLAAAARSIAWTSDETWDRVESSLKGPFQRKLFRDRDLGPGVILREGVVRLTQDADPATDPLLVLRMAVGAAHNNGHIDRTSLERLALTAPKLPDPWPDEARELFVQLFLAGRPAVHVIETLDQRGLWVRILPEWTSVRCKPQRNAYHTFTVDRHLCETAINASALVDRVDRPDLLITGALLHDIGKGYPGDHVEVGIDIIERMATRMGFDPADVAVLQDMVRYHLLLPDIATRRDLSDDGTITMVAGAVGSLGTLRLLDVLTEADSIATGPAGWNEWKAELVAELVSRAAHVLGGGAVEELTTEAFPNEAQLAKMAERRLVIEGLDDRLLVISPDRPGLFARAAGVLALNGLDVLEAAAHSSDDGMALEVFRVESGSGPVIAWDRVIADLEKALDGRLALNARLAERAERYPRRRVLPFEPAPPSVLVENDLSRSSTVIEVRAPDAIGVLYRITHALAECDLDIRTAKAQTLANEVVDSFYVRDRAGHKVTDEGYLVEIERALLHALSV